ncbi:uncharacterized protein LOC112056305 [Bicyclus anynana]|uniref:Uncharacterized protein LOC112056305 n=1 Tax=Bicyclus anynana TaxID=110368 RepID=A0A6J1P2V9_BICAN|nr:uncharacterized protein LOC112056305 [Bicyclus anynana]
MPEDSKKNQQKGKNDPKDQRKRRGRQHTAQAEGKVEKQPEAPKAPEKPAYEPPPPEFYQNLKRETDEILKITEEANSKYKKKEIQSNWAKYEMPIESYEEIDEQENLGADYETLIQAPLTVGAHFQFKHEKSWDISTSPSPYDKYFDINMDNLFIALSTIPFYERNSIDTSIFNETDIQNMDHRANKLYKYKYYNDKKFISPAIEASEKIQNLLKSNDKDDEIESDDTLRTKSDETLNQLKDIKLEECEEHEYNKDIKDDNQENTVAIKAPNTTIDEPVQCPKSVSADNFDLSNDTNKTIIQEDKETKTNKICDTDKKSDENKITFNELKNDKVKTAPESESKLVVSKPVDSLPKEKESLKASSPQKDGNSVQNPVIESPEDLEKWLDDFLDS